MKHSDGDTNTTAIIGRKVAGGDANLKHKF